MTEHDDLAMPPDPLSNAASLTAAMMGFNEAIEPVLTLGSTIRNKLKADDWNEELACNIAAGVMTFWINQYMTLVAAAIAASTQPPVTVETTLEGAT